MANGNRKEEGGTWLEDYGGAVLKTGVIFLTVLSVFFAIKIVNEIRSGEYIGAGVIPTNTISVSGKGEVFGVPNIAEFTFSVNEKGDTVTVAQKKATEKMNAVLAYLKGAKISDKDIKTQSYNINPMYEYQQSVCTKFSCPPARSILTGYEVSQSVSVKVRDVARAGEVLSGIGSLEVQNLSGLNLTVDNQDALAREARQIAISDAEVQAKNLAKDLGVRLVRIVSFNESGYNPPMPMYFSKDSYATGSVANPAPEIPVGQNKITSNVTITYEIR